MLTDWMNIEKELMSKYGYDTLAKFNLLTRELIMKKWESLKRTFTLKRKVKCGKSGAAARDASCDWPHLNSMMFLLATRPVVETSSSLPMSSQVMWKTFVTA